MMSDRKRARVFGENEMPNSIHMIADKCQVGNPDKPSSIDGLDITNVSKGDF